MHTTHYRIGDRIAIFAFIIPNLQTHTTPDHTSNHGA